MLDFGYSHEEDPSARLEDTILVCLKASKVVWYSAKVFGLSGLRAMTLKNKNRQELNPKRTRGMLTGGSELEMGMSVSRNLGCMRMHVKGYHDSPNVVVRQFAIFLDLHGGLSNGS